MTSAVALLAIQEPDMVALSRGSVVLRTPGHGSTSEGAVQGLALVPVPPAAAWALLEQWERVHEALPTLRFRVLQRTSGARGERHEVLSAEVDVGLMKMRYSVRATFSPAERRQWWSLIPNDEIKELMRELPGLSPNSRLLQSTRGNLTVFSHEGGSLILHENCLVPHRAIPRAIEMLLSRQMVRDFLGAIRDELLRDAGQSLLAADLALGTDEAQPR